MLRLGSALLTPLRARFEEIRTPRSTAGTLTIEPDGSGPHTYSNYPEDFARDTRIEVMRRSTEDLKATEGLVERKERLSEILRMMIEDASTKDVFRELDGFLVLVSILSGIRSYQQPLAEEQDNASDIERKTADIGEPQLARVEVMRLVFAVISESIKDHPANKQMFENEIGYHALTHTIYSVIETDSSASFFLFGYLVALAFHNFSLSDIFCDLAASKPADTQSIDALISDIDPQFTTLHNPNAIISITRLCMPPTPSHLSYASFKIIERIIHSSHRSRAILNSLGLGGALVALRHQAKTNQVSDPFFDLVLTKKILKMTWDMGAPVDEARSLFRSILQFEGDKISLDSEALGDAKAALRSTGKWPPFVSFGANSRNEQNLSASATITSGLEFEVVKVPNKPYSSSGLTFLAWVYIEKLSENDEGVIGLLEIRTKASSQSFIALRVLPAGRLLYSSEQGSHVLELIDKTWRFPLRRWTHICLIHHPSHTSSPTIRIFVDGSLCATGNSPIPRAFQSPISIFIGNSSNLDLVSSKPIRRRGHQSTPSTSFSLPWLITSRPTWYLASSYLFSQSLPNDLPKLIYTLGPRYVGNFQDSLGKFLTYQSSTSLNIVLSNPVSHQTWGASGPSALVSAIKNGLGVNEDSIVFAFSPLDIGAANNNLTPHCDINFPEVLGVSSSRRDKGPRRIKLNGDDVMVCLIESWDDAIWRMGGAAVLLRIVEIASTEDDVYRAISVLSDAVRSSWRNSEDMERICGYEILMSILRTKPRLLNQDAFEALLGLLGIDFRHPQNSTITNPVAYRIIALDFPFWASTCLSTQHRYLEHFSILLQTSRFRAFNCSKSRFGTFGVMRKLVVALQTTTFKEELTPRVVQVLSVVAREVWSTDSTIKPIVRYLVDSLSINNTSPEDSQPTPSSFIASKCLEKGIPQERAEQVFAALLEILTSSTHLTKFKSVLPFPRLCLLFIGTTASPVVISLILDLVSMVLTGEPSYARKLESVSFWDVLVNILPSVWDPQVHIAAFDVLLGRSFKRLHQPSTAPSVACPYIMPAILASLDRGLRLMISEHVTQSNSPSTSLAKAKATVDVLAEEIIDLHTSSPTFRVLFQSKRIVLQFVSILRNFVFGISVSPGLRYQCIQIFEKLNHLGLMLVLDSALDDSQKQQLIDILHTAQDSSGALTQTGILLPTISTANQSPRQDMLPPGSGSSMTKSKSLEKISAWRSSIINMEQKRLRKALQDHREYLRQSQRPNGWRDHLHVEHGLWPCSRPLLFWKLDETEGPFRVRKKLEPELVSCRVDSSVRATLLQEVNVPEDDNRSMMQTEVPPWADSYELSTTQVDGENNQLAEDPLEDKHRRVRHELEPGDTIDEVMTVARIVGVDASPGLLVLGRTHLYVIDGLVERQDGEIIDIKDAPKDILLVPGSVLELDKTQMPQRWHLNQVTSSSSRMHLFRDVALELYFKDGRNLLIAFPLKANRKVFSERLYQNRDKLGDQEGNRSPLFSRVSARLSRPLFSWKDELIVAQKRWQTRELSNYSYLSIINQASGRTPGDLTQYPVFPWVLKDYDSECLDFNNPDIFRDLSTPMGALSTVKREAAEMRYMNLQQVGEAPFHYGTHFSSSMIVSHFLIRLSPFSHYFKVLQGGNWDLPDRLFTDVKRSWESASLDSRGDVRELIPEFFTCPEFLLNLSKLDFGTQTISQEKVDSVKLPPWAKQDPYLFIALHRQALESDAVSKYLPSWIDLIWGYKQQDPAALNVFHPLSYEGAIDLDSITDELEKEATASIIHNFGQTPRKIFHGPHPPRFFEGTTTLPVGTMYGIAEDSHLLLQSPRPTLIIESPIACLSLSTHAEQVVPCSDSVALIPQYPRECVQWGFSDESLRFYHDNHIVQTVEAVSVTCCAIREPSTMVTGSSDTMVRIWRILRQGPKSSISQTNIMRGHGASICCISLSHAWSLIVSGSQDGVAIFWDLNRAKYVRSIEHPTTLTACAIQESSGHIATASGSKLQIHTLNGHLIASLELTEKVLSLAFHEREWTPVPVLASGGMNGNISLWTWNANDTPPGHRARWKLTPLQNLHCRKSDVGVTALLFVGETLYSGDTNGCVFSWDLPDAC